MEHISNGVSKKFFSVNNDNNVNRNIANNDNNDTSKKNKYALNKSKFIPNTEATQLAEKISSFFNDLNNYAFYLMVVNRLGAQEAYTFWRSVQDEMKEKKDTRYEIRSPKKYFAWKFKKGLH